MLYRTILTLCIAGTVMTSDGLMPSAYADEKETARPSKSYEEVLQRFVDECVTITPGKGKFPTEFTYGTAGPSRYELARRKVQMSGDFRISRYEVTQELYQAVSGKNPSRWKGPRNSVETVSWQDAVQFCRQLTALLQKQKLIAEDEVVRLPTSVEWEYCCRAGTETMYSFGQLPGPDSSTEILDQHAWHTGNAAGNDPAVGILKPNKWGLYDVHGYLWEYVSDSSPDDIPDSDAESSEIPATRMIRGGSWRDHHSLLSSSAYLLIPDHASSDAIGLRCVISRRASAKNSSGR